MNCPHCGSPEKARIRECQQCGTSYASEDLLALRQLEFLLTETAVWPEAETRQKPYRERLLALKERLIPHQESVSEAEAAPTPEAIPTAVLSTVAVTSTDAIASAVAVQEPATATLPEPTEPEPTEPTAESVPFEQWLLSERNIKMALYGGGIMLVLAGFIFVGANWTRIPGPGKFALIFMVTGLLYLAGYLLFQRPTLRVGGVALLGIGAGFIPLNFVVLQIYIFSERGLDANVMWLIGSVVTLLLYMLTTFWTRESLFTYMSLTAIASSLTAALVLANAPLLGFTVAYAVLLLLILLGAYSLKNSSLAPFTYKPFLIFSQGLMPFLLLGTFASWLMYTAELMDTVGNPWLAVITMFIGVISYMVIDLVFGHVIVRWISVFTFAATFFMALIELGLEGTTFGVALMLLAFSYLLIGYVVKDRTETKEHTWPLYTASYAVAIFTTFIAIPPAMLDGNSNNLALTLVAVVILLASSAWVHRNYRWVYGATWLFMAPVYIYANIYLDGFTNQGLALGVLMLNYVVIGYALGRRTLSLSGPFLTAAAFLSVAVVGLTWNNTAVASFTLILIAMLYLFIALWLERSWLIIPALIAVNLAVMTLVQNFSGANAPLGNTLTIAYASLSVFMTLGGIWLRQVGQKMWGWPLYLIAAFNFVGSYLAAMLLGGWLAVALSLAFALLAFGVSWMEQENLTKAEKPPVFTFLGAILLTAGHFYLLDLLFDRATEIWPPYTALLATLFVGLSWLLPDGQLQELFGKPFRWFGLLLMIIPAGGVMALSNPLLGVIIFTIIGVAYAVDAGLRRDLILAYLSSGAFVLMIWSALAYFEISELQAYVIPLGLTLLTIGWVERGQKHTAVYQIFTILGLLILMGSAFYQSLDTVAYAVLLLFESLIAFAWGVRVHSRGYAIVAALAIVANILAQIGPAFIELPRWIQIGAVGTILVGGGLIALRQREQLLSTRTRLANEWRQWDA